MKTIQESVAEKITNCSEKVINAVVEKIAELEISKRIELITKAINKQEQLEKELKKINKNDVFQFINGVQQEAMSKTRYDEINKSKERITNLKKVIDTALEANSYDAYAKVTEVLNKLNNVGGGKQESTGDTEPKQQ